MTISGGENLPLTHMPLRDVRNTFKKAAGDMSKLSPKGKKVNQVFSSNSVPGRKGKGGTLVIHF